MDELWGLWFSLPGNVPVSQIHRAFCFNVPFDAYLFLRRNLGAGGKPKAPEAFSLLNKHCPVSQEWQVQMKE